jgi:hypothetical protein
MKKEIIKMLSISCLTSNDIKEKLICSYPGVNHNILNETIHNALEELIEDRKLFFDFKRDTWSVRNN